MCACVLVVALAASLGAHLPVRHVASSRAHVRAMSSRFPGGGRADGTVGGAVAGAALGGLLGGPLGMLLGAQLGRVVGSGAAEQRAEVARLERMGLTRADLQGAQEIVANLAEATESMQLVADAASGARARTRTLSEEADAAYAKAGQALADGDEAGARRWLERREDARAKLAQAQITEAEAEERVVQMRVAIDALTVRAAEMQAAINRTVAASTALRASDEREQQSGRSAFAEPTALDELPVPRDSLEARFRELER
jgi:hypothetical protein